MRELAASLGVSTATVSRALSDDVGRLSPAAKARREKIRAYAEQLGYRPAYAVKAFHRGATGLIGFLVPGEQPITQGVYGPALTGIISALRRRQMVVALQPIGEEPTDDSAFLDRKFDGMIVPNVLDRALERAIKRAQVPAVLLNVKPTTTLPAVYPDERAGAQMLTRYLLSNRHRSILYATTEHQRQFSWTDRQAGYEDAMKASGQRAEVLVHEPGHVGRVIERVRSAGHTAIIFHGESNAVLALGVLRRAGLRCPEDVSVATFNDTAIATLADPPLTCIHVPFVRLGGEAVELLMRELEKGDPRRDVRDRSIVVPTELVVRGSTRPL